jgi:hypothetical protein
MLADILKRAIGAIPLTAITTFVTQFSDLLHVPYLTHPDWSAAVNQSIRPFGVVAVLIIFIVFYLLGKTPLRWISLGLLVLSFGLMLVCYRFSSTIDSIPDPETTERTIGLWKEVYMAACLSLVAAATTVGLWFTAK